MDIDDDLKKLLGGEEDDTSSPKKVDDRVGKGIKRTQVSLGQQQTLSFLLIEIWVTVAQVLAPFFAVLIKKQAQAKANQLQAKKDLIPDGGK